MLTLAEFAQQYVDSRVISAMYAGTIMRRARALELHAGTAAVPDVLTEAAVNAFLASLVVSPHTRKSYRGDLLMLWRAAADDGLVAYPIPRRIRRERLPALVVQCYSHAEATAMLAATDKLRGGMANGVGRRAYWRAMIMAGWETGLRRGDLWRLRRDAIRPDGSAVIAQHKTGKLVVCRLRASTLAAVDAIGGPTPLAWPYSGWAFGEQFRKIVRLSGVNRGSFKWLRRASGSYVEAATPGAGHKHLGHAHADTFSAHYDAQLGGAPRELPPPLDG